MIAPLPKWIMLAYSRLWTKFKAKQFTFSQAEKLLKLPNTSIILSRLKKYGWLIVELDPNDSRKRLYKLISPLKAVEEMAK